MDVVAIDHVNLRVPADGVDEATAFYGDRLGFAVEGLDRYRDGEQSFFDVRLTPGAVVHLWPTDAFEPPSGDGFDHLALRIEADREAVVERLSAAGVDVEMELDAPLGATGRAPAVYVEDPFGYRLELKTAA
ncbi:lactoylglutathione lyase [Halobacteriales archaeon QS_4_69_225]|nr:MAG: lactoylglutathione lyase [Halobacteriales archaeon QS_4_69_225]